MIEMPSVAFRQSSRDRRSPMTNSTFLPAGNRSSASFKRDKRLDGRTKQRRLAKPHSRSFSTTFEPIKPLDPVTRMQSFGEPMNLQFIMVQTAGKLRAQDRPTLRLGLTGATNRFTLRNDLKVTGRLQ